MKILPALSFLALAASWHGAAHAATPCQSLKGFTFGDATVLAADPVEGENFAAPDGQTYKGVAPFCRVIARAAPSPQSNILIEVWLPSSDRWNGKLLGTGNGGFAGSIRYSALAGGLKYGYAVANTDMGTFPAGVGSVGYEAGNGRPEVVKDWAYRATHEMTVLSKALIQRFYAKAPQRSYFSGCSTGGHQGLTEAQRYPDDYDAILAGAAGHNRTHLHAAFTQMALSSKLSGGDWVSPAKLALFSSTALKSCVGKDGGAPGDLFLTDPSQCGFKPKQLLCKRNTEASQCLTAGEVKTLDWMMGGVRNPRTGELIYPGLSLGSESILTFMAPEMPNERMPVELARWVFGPQWDPTTFSFDADMTRVDDELGPIVNDMDPDLSRFVARGGKLIMFHGWADAIVRPIDSILYYDRLTAAGADRDSYARLFMAPGVSHCAGGIGPDMFGQGAEFGGNANPEFDLLAALDRWSTAGVAPEHVIASKYEKPFSSEGMATASRPICAYPKIAKYQGGDPTLASSFRCDTAAPARYERPAAAYLR